MGSLTTCPGGNVAHISACRDPHSLR